MFETLISIIFSKWTLILGVVLYFAYKWLTANYDFFEKKNVAFKKPHVLFGNFKPLFSRKESVFDMFKRFYMENKHLKFFGMFEMRNPILVVNDRELIKQIMIKDFDHFTNRRIIVDSEDEPLIGNSLLALEDEKWKDMRGILSPTFTGSKMRLMFQLVDECGRNASEFLKSEAEISGEFEIELKDFFTRFTNDVIATCAFGVDINSLTEKDNEFYLMSRKAIKFSGFAAFKFFLFANFRRIMKVLKLRLFDKKFSDYFYCLVMDAVNERAAHGIMRPDMINLLMEARKAVLQTHDVNPSASEHTAVTHNWTDEEMVAQCFLFFIAGFETVSVLMCFCAHELMENPDVQRRLIDEIDNVREKLGDKPLTYDVIKNMKYMDMVMNETLRKWPPGVGTDRVCTKPYVLGDKKGEHVKLDRGDVVFVLIAGIHHDPDYYPNPDKFDPERFSDENKDKIEPFTHMPFGVGPRNCIGSRFALMESKAIIFHLLSKFTFEASPKTCRPLRLDKSGFQIIPEGGFWLKFKPRN